jgi:transcription elongation factor Elf1
MICPHCQNKDESLMEILGRSITNQQETLVVHCGVCAKKFYVRQPAKKV